MIKNITRKQWTILILILLTIIVTYFILPITIPLILAFLTALLFNPLIRLLTHRFRLSRKIAVIAIFLFYLIAIVTIGTYTTTKAIGQVIKITDNIPYYISNIENVLVDVQTKVDTFTQDWPDQFIDTVADKISASLDTLEQQTTDLIDIENVAQIVMKIPQFLINFIVYLIALFLFMLEMPTLRDKFYNLMTERTQEKFKFMNARLSYVLLGFLKAQFLVSLIIFSVTLIGLLIFTPEVALVMSIIIWIIDLIPIIGSIIILGPWSIYMFLAGDVVLGTELAILAIILLAIRRTIEPKVMGDQIGLSPLPTLIAMFIGLQLLGIIGFFLGPLVVILFNSAKEAGIIKFNFKL
ncbi:sporulation integral membrane protein YtvI [Bacillaceae bacterium W0354]